MKKVTIKGKLSLNKVTITALNENKLKDVKGGGTKKNCGANTKDPLCETNEGCHLTNWVICFP